MGRDVAWALDLTVQPATGAGDAIGAMLHQLTERVRRQGLIQVTTERFA
ncbi:hypothetical protein AB0F81_24365 [Actinoplanes sp. NPDC024001]